MNRYLSLPIFLLPVLLAGSSAFADFSATPLFATADTFVTSADPTHNYGAAGALQVSASGEPKGELQSLLRFNTNAAKTQFDTQFGAGNWVITSATLSMGTNFGGQGAVPNNSVFNNINAGNFNIDLLQNDTWLEGTGTPAAPTTDGITFNGIAGILSANDSNLGVFHWSAPGNVVANWSLDLDTNLLADADAGSDVNFRLYAADTAVSYLFNSRTFPTVANEPVLTFTAVALPEPSSLLILAMGAAAFFVRQRRENRP